MIEHYDATRRPQRTRHKNTETCPDCSPELVAKINKHRERVADRALDREGARAVDRVMARRSYAAPDLARRIINGYNIDGTPTTRSVRGVGDRPALIKRMTERDIYDLGRLRIDPFGDPAGSREMVDRARRAVDLADLPTAPDQDHAKDHIDKLLKRSDRLWNPSELARRILTTGSDQYREIFARMITSGMKQGFLPTLGREESLIIQRAMSVGTGSAGGFAVNWQLDPTIVPTSNGSVNPYRQVCRVITISTNEWRQASASGVTLAYSGESTPVTDNSPTFAQDALVPQRVVGFVPMSHEIGEDWGAAEAELGKLINDAKDDLEATKFAVGSGTGEPAGMVTGATNVTVVGATFDVQADLWLAETNLAARFRPRAQWFGNRAIYQLARNFAAVSTVAGPTFDHVVGGDTEMIGYRANEASGMTSAVTTGSKILILGDPQYFVIVDHVGLDLEIASQIHDTATGFPKGQRGLVLFYRNTSAVLDPAAFRTLAIT